jgi:hypothetical protein
LVVDWNAGMTYRKADEKDFDAGVEEDVVTAEA